MSDNMKLATPDDMWKAYRGTKTCITAARVPDCEPKTIIGWVFPKEMHDFLKTMQYTANWYVYAITKPSETTNLAGLSNRVPEFNRWHCALVLKPEYIDRYFVMCSDRMELGVLETMFGMDQDGDDIIILKEEKVPDSNVLTITEGETSDQQRPKGDLDKLIKYHGRVAGDLMGASKFSSIFMDHQLSGEWLRICKQYDPNLEKVITEETAKKIGINIPKTDVMIKKINELIDSFVDDSWAAGHLKDEIADILKGERSDAET